MVNSNHKTITCGVPQGSVIGPTLWNVLYDELLTLPMPQGVELEGFADDVAIVATAHNKFLLEDFVNRYSYGSTTGW